MKNLVVDRYIFVSLWGHIFDTVEKLEKAGMQWWSQLSSIDSKSLWYLSFHGMSCFYDEDVKLGASIVGREQLHRQQRVAYFDQANIWNRERLYSYDLFPGSIISVMYCHYSSLPV